MTSLSDTPSLDLTGHLLIAMPTMGDPRFERSVVYMCSHGADGAMGLIVNKPATDVKLSGLLEQLDIERGDGFVERPVHFGGPVEGSRGFVLHSCDYRSALETIDAGDGFAMTATVDILEDIACAKGPKKSIMALGYAGWGPGQLENEIAMNGWLTVPADPEIVFDVADGAKWEGALGRLGIEPLMLSGSAGHA